MMDFVKKMAGKEYVGFSNATWVLNVYIAAFNWLYALGIDFV